jgi:type I restriction enzyme M protein
MKRYEIRWTALDPTQGAEMAKTCHERAETWSEANPEGRWRCYDYEYLMKRDELSLDLFWIKDKSLTDTDSLPAPGIIAAEIADDLEAALEQFTKIAERLK